MKKWFIGTLLAWTLFLCPPMKASTVTTSLIAYASFWDCAMWTTVMLIGDMTGNNLGATAAQNELIQLGCKW